MTMKFVAFFILIRQQLNQANVIVYCPEQETCYSHQDFFLVEFVTLVRWYLRTFIIFILENIFRGHN